MHLGTILITMVIVGTVHGNCLKAGDDCNFRACCSGFKCVALIDSDPLTKRECNARIGDKCSHFNQCPHRSDCRKEECTSCRLRSEKCSVNTQCCNDMVCEKRYRENDKKCYHRGCSALAKPCRSTYPCCGSMVCYDMGEIHKCYHKRTYGLPHGAVCQNIKECSESQVCTYETAKGGLTKCLYNTCAYPGLDCRAQKDCCAGSNCINNKCCLMTHQKCIRDTSCCSQFCDNGICCYPFQTKCIDNDSCCSRTCGTSGYCCGTKGLKCGSDPDCCSTLECWQGKCLLKVGERCTNDKDCSGRLMCRKGKCAV